LAGGTDKDIIFRLGYSDVQGGTGCHINCILDQVLIMLSGTTVLDSYLHPVEVPAEFVVVQIAAMRNVTCNIFIL
jgi:hypothetical protein